MVENVFELQVTVNDVAGVHVLHGIEELLSNDSGLFLAEFSLSERQFPAELQDKANASLIFNYV